MDSIKKALSDAKDSVEKCLHDDELHSVISELAMQIAQTFNTGNKIIICGNGGSNADAVHFAEEFTGRFRNDRIALPVIALSDSSHITCVGNDYGFSAIFQRGVEAFGKKDDLFIGISTSGNSDNVLKALLKAKINQLKTFVLLGKDGGKMKNIADWQIIIPGNTTDRIQEIHMLILHILIETVERILFPENYENCCSTG
jgi:D-sedoheptulose 7-phosphate isomerase